MSNPYKPSCNVFETMRAQLVAVSLPTNSIQASHRCYAGTKRDGMQHIKAQLSSSKVCGEAPQIFQFSCAKTDLDCEQNFRAAMVDFVNTFGECAHTGEF